MNTTSHSGANLDLNQETHVTANQADSEGSNSTKVKKIANFRAKI